MWAGGSGVHLGGVGVGGAARGIRSLAIFSPPSVNVSSLMPWHPSRLGDLMYTVWDITTPSC